MGLPTSTEGPIGSHAPITSTRIAAIEACIIGRKFPPTWNWRLPLGRPASEINVAWDTVGGFVKATGGGALLDMVPITPDVGDRITDIGARILGTGAGGPVVVRLWRQNGDGTRAPLATLTVVAPPAVWALYTVALGPAEVVADQKGYSFEVDLPTANQAIHLVGFRSDRL
jgi:hypothetical protein